MPQHLHGEKTGCGTELKSEQNWKSPNVYCTSVHVYVNVYAYYCISNKYHVYDEIVSCK